MRNKYKNWAFLFFLNAILCSACFNTRKPEAPVGPTNWTPPTEPKILLENFSKASKDVDINNIKRCLKTSSYVFKADPLIAANNLGIFGNWGWDDEQQYLNNLNIRKSPSTGINGLTFQNEQTNNFTQDSIEYTANYIYSMATTDTSALATTFSGVVIFRLVRNISNEWQIVYWSDNQINNKPCWSDLKLYFFTR